MQKQWLIDAHNLMHLIPSVVKGYSNSRLDGIEYLTSLVDGICLAQKRNALLIFDGYPLHIGMKPHRCSIAFGGGKSADEAIINRLKKKNSADRYIVVSNDNEVIAQARAQGAETLSASDFARQITPRPLTSRTSGPVETSHPEKRVNVEVSDSEVEEMLRLFKKGRP
ncbi:MAG: NYN domain-containing protein [Balneolales bacterium]